MEIFWEWQHWRSGFSTFLCAVHVVLLWVHLHSLLSACGPMQDNPGKLLGSPDMAASVVNASTLFVLCWLLFLSEAQNQSNIPDWHWEADRALNQTWFSVYIEYSGGRSELSTVFSLAARCVGPELSFKTGINWCDGQKIGGELKRLGAFSQHRGAADRHGAPPWFTGKRGFALKTTAKDWDRHSGRVGGLQHLDSISGSAAHLI